MFEAPAGLRYTCSGCGDCCRGTNVPLVPGERERLAALDWCGRVDSLAGEPRVSPLPRPSGGVTHRLERGEDGACAYLAEDSACLIHRHFGETAKPLACRLYPFQLRPIGERTCVDVAFSCKAVSHGKGAPVQEQEGDWAALLEVMGGSLPEPRHELTKSQALDGELLRELEQDLEQFLRREDLGFLERVRCCLDHARLATTGDPGSDSGRTLRQAMLTALPAQVKSRPVEVDWDKTQRAVFFQWTFLATNPPAVNVDLLPPPKRRSAERQRAVAGQGYREPGNPVWIAGRESQATHGDVMQVDAAWIDEDAEGLLRDFFTAKLLGGRYLLAGEKEEPFARAVPKLLIWYPMLLWAAKAFAADRRAARTSLEDLRSALRLLDPPVGQLTTAALPAPQRKACDFVFLETDVVAQAGTWLLGR